MPSSEFTLWVAYFRQFPYDDGLADIVATLCNIHRDKNKRPQGFSRGDFLPGWKQDVDEDPGVGLFKRLRAMAKRNG